MGKKKRGRPSKKQSKTITNDVLGGFLVVLGVILTVFIGFKNVGSFAQICKVVFLGALGKFAYSIPVLLISVGIYCIVSDKKVNPLSEIRKGLLIIALVAAVLTVFTENNVSMFVNPVKTIADSVNQGIEKANFGGAIGTAIGGAVAGVIGMTAARLILPVFTLVISLFVLDISFKQFFGGIVYAFNYAADHINNLINTLFRDDEVKKYEYTDNFGEKVPKLSRREKARIEREEQERQERLAEKGNPDADENLAMDTTEQVEFDFSKLGGKPKVPTQQEIEGKRKRDEFFTEKKEQKEDKSIKEVLTLEHTAHVEDDNYIFPPITLLSEGKGADTFDRKAIHAVAVRLQKTLASFGVEAKVTNITKGPTVTRYELTPSVGVKVSKIVNLTDDIALNLAAKSIRIEAPIPGKAAGALNWAVQEMENRYKLFAQHKVKDLKGYNELMEKEEEGIKLPQMVIIIDELADLMMIAPNDVETAICRIAQKARAAGMHLIVATQRPSVDVITGLIKANVPSRIAFTVSNQVDSRTILDMAGAEKLLGKGDMLYYPVGENKPLRIQGTFISEKEIENVVDNIKSNSNAVYSEEIIKSIETVNNPDNKNQVQSGEDADDSDELLEEAIDLVMDMGQASASMLQRKFKIGYSRAGRIVDQMEARGLISGYDGSKPRQLLITKDEWQELKMGKSLPNEEDNTEEDNDEDEVFISNSADSNVESTQRKSNIDIEL